jgi:hypothetical protein
LQLIQVVGYEVQVIVKSMVWYNSYTHLMVDKPT